MRRLRSGCGANLDRSMALEKFRESGRSTLLARTGSSARSLPLRVRGFPPDGEPARPAPVVPEWEVSAHLGQARSKPQASQRAGRLLAGCGIGSQAIVANLRTLLITTR